MNIITNVLLATSLGISFSSLSYIPTNSLIVKNEVVYKLGDTIPESEIDSLIAKYATGTKAYQMKRTIFCESLGYKNIQSNIIKNSIREDSWGIAQINLYWNPKVSREQALDPEFSIKWMSDNWKTSKWFGYFKDTDSCNTIY